MLAIGYNSKGERKEFDCFNCFDFKSLLCSNKDLISLILPEGVISVYCHDNNLSELIIPSGVEMVYCYNNLITELIIPSSVNLLSCDREVDGLEHLIGDIEIRLW